MGKISPVPDPPKTTWLRYIPFVEPSDDSASNPGMFISNLLIVFRFNGYDKPPECKPIVIRGHFFRIPLASGEVVDQAPTPPVDGKDAAADSLVGSADARSASVTSDTVPFVHFILRALCTLPIRLTRNDHILRPSDRAAM